MHGYDQLPHKPGVYLIRNLTTGHVYVGASVDVRVRLKQHRSDLRSDRHHNSFLQRAWNKYGELDFSVGMLEVVPPERLSEAEERWVGIHRSLERDHGYNRHPLHWRAGFRWSTEAKQRMSEQRRGRTLSPEWRARISAAGRGRTMPSEQREKIRQANLGHPVSEATRQNISQARTGQPISPEHLARFHAAARAAPRSPAQREALACRNRAREWSAASRAKLGASRARPFELVDPEGTVHRGTNLSRFCRDRQLNNGNISQLLHGKLLQVMGWRLSI